jgi:nucleotide-binding universal stress UspA family protein
MPPTGREGSQQPGPVLFAYDGSELARLAIERAGHELARDREAIVLCVWQPADVGFIPVGEQHFDAQDASKVQAAAQETAAQGASFAGAAGFRSEPLTVEAAPTWKGIVKVAEEREASLIVLGSHHRTGIVGHLLGSVTASVVNHCSISVLVVHQQT